MIIDYKELRKQAGFDLPPVDRRWRKIRRWARRRHAPLMKRSIRLSPDRRAYAKYIDQSDRKIIIKRMWEVELKAREFESSSKAAQGLVQYDISHRSSDLISVSVFADLLKVKRSGDTRGGGGLRGDVAGFSRASRKRMMEAMASTKDLDARPGLFFTLTYPDLFPLDSDNWHRDLDVFLKRLKRKFPGVGWFWRLEMKVRLSGVHSEGIYAPHFHLIVFMADKFRGKRLNWLRRWVAAAWYVIVASNDPRHERAGTEVSVIESRAHAMRYCSKYAAKESEYVTDMNTGEIIGDGFAVGRRWGCGGVLDRSVQWSARITRQAFYDFKRYAARLLKSRGRKYASKLARSSPMGGFTVYGLGSQSSAGWGSIFDSTVYHLLIDAVALANQHPKEIPF